MGRKSRRWQTNRSNLQRARELNVKNKCSNDGQQSTEQADNEPKKKRRKKLNEVLSSPSVRVKIRYNDVEHEMLEACIQAKIILNRKRRLAKPSCVQGTFREAGVSRGICLASLA